jgi:HEPN domain-containing protein
MADWVSGEGERGKETSDAMLKATENWLAQVDYDLAAAEHMLNSGRYIYVIFMCHLALEKAMKAVVSEETQKLPPRTHDLLSLLQRAHLTPSQEYLHFLSDINDASVVTRYPDDLSKLVSQYPEPVAREYWEKAKEVIAWIRQDPRLQAS